MLCVYGVYANVWNKLWRANNKLLTVVTLQGGNLDLGYSKRWPRKILTI